MNEQQQQIIREILGYLVRHPDAKDDIDGIRHWWLPPKLGAISADEIEEIVRMLAMNRLLEERYITANERVFSSSKMTLLRAAEYLHHSTGVNHEV